MRCRFPLDMSYTDDCVTTTFSRKLFSKEIIPWQVPCGKCLECRLEYARQWAVRCVHEAQMHEENSFITLTYDNENVGDGRLRYSDFQLFMKRLRRSINEPISMFVTGEYGDQKKRPHWHALVFGWRPSDCNYKYSNKRGDRVFESNTLERLWTHGISEVGSVTFESAGYCARYAAKKLIHGRDADHDFQPISKKSSKYAIGKKWLEKFYLTDCFNHGRIVLDSETMVSIPRYYEKWFKENHPEEYLCYIREVKYPMINKQIMLRDLDTKAYYQNVDERTLGKEWPLTSKQIQSVILESNFNLLQEYLKL